MKIDSKIVTKVWVDLIISTTERKESMNHLTECEKQVMKCVWRADRDLTMMEIVEIVNKEFDKSWKPQTISTFLSRLVKKDFLDMYRKGRQFYYHSLIQEKSYSQHVVNENVKFWFDGDASKLIEAVRDERSLSKEEIENIKKIIAK